LVSVPTQEDLERVPVQKLPFCLLRAAGVPEGAIWAEAERRQALPTAEDMERERERIADKTDLDKVASDDSWEDEDYYTGGVHRTEGIAGKDLQRRRCSVEGGGGSTEEGTPNAYEEQRASNIRYNTRLLRRFGLDGNASDGTLLDDMVLNRNGVHKVRA
jgi:hypothetical protein